MSASKPRVRVSTFIHARPEQVFKAFTEPDWLTRFWLAASSGPLRLGHPVEWEFMVPGAKDTVTATQLDPDEIIAWEWSDGVVRIELESFEDGTAVTLVNDRFPGSNDEQVEAALNGTEGFSIVLCDLKTLLESGKCAGLTKAKARLIQARR